MKVWKVVSRKLLYGKQTWPKCFGCDVNGGPNAIDSSGQARPKIAFDLAGKMNQIALDPALLGPAEQKGPALLGHGTESDLISKKNKI
jgi:hypothetical protein